MKKAILAIILIVALGCGGVCGYMLYANAPEQKIIGTWNNDSAKGLYYEFKKDGAMSGKAEIPILSTTTGIDGTYTLDKKTNTLSITYQIKSSLLSLETDKNVKKTYEFTKEGKLILTDENGNATTFTKAEK